MAEQTLIQSCNLFMNGTAIKFPDARTGMVVAIFSDFAKDICEGLLSLISTDTRGVKKGDTFCHGFGFWLDLSDTQDALRDK